MAIEHNAISYGTQLSKAASSAFGLAEGEPGLGRLGETLQPVADLWQRPEWALLRGEIWFGRWVVSVAVALRNSVIELTLASTARQLAVIRVLAQANAFDIAMDNGAAVAANPLTSRGVATDHRYPQVGEVSQLLITTGDTATGATLPIVRSVSTVWSPYFVLNPGGRLFIANPTQAELIAANILWYERPPFPGELQARG